MALKLSFFLVSATKCKRLLQDAGLQLTAENLAKGQAILEWADTADEIEEVTVIHEGDEGVLGLRCS